MSDKGCTTNTAQWRTYAQNLCNLCNLWRLYVGYLNGRPVATNILFNGAGVASVYGVGTLPEARGKGIGAAITLKPLLDARAQGYRYGVLFATEMGVPVYRRLGFREVGCTIGRYLWING